MLYWTIAVIGGFMLIILEGSNVNSYVIAIFVLISRIGMTSAFNIVYIATPYLFPVIFGSTCLGIFNFWARLVSIIAPVAAELEYPVPMSLFTGTSILAFIVAFFIKEKIPKVK